MLGKENPDENRSNESHGPPEIIIFGSGEAGGRTEDQICFRGQHCLLPSYGKESLKLHLGIATVPQTRVSAAPGQRERRNFSRDPAAHQTGRQRCR